MIVFNLAEELEKERKKNKELEKELKSIKENYKIQLEYDEELETRIDKAVEHIEKHQLVFQSQYEEMSGFDNHLLDILKGENNE